jgi:hypothetical protein
MVWSRHAAPDQAVRERDRAVWEMVRRRHGVLACGDGAVLSHRSAAELWGIGHEERGRIDVTIRRRSKITRSGIKVRARPSLSSRSITRRHGIPVTDPVQTLIDLATELLPLRLERAVNEADKLALAAGLPLPLTKDLVLGFEADFFLPDHDLIVETDGLRYHRTPAQQARAARRNQTHTAAGSASSASRTGRSLTPRTR